MLTKRLCTAFLLACVAIIAGCRDGPIEPERSGNLTPSFYHTDAPPGSPVTGAIWTSDQNRTIVNANHYDAKEDVYLNGGPLANNPTGPGSLSPSPAWYFFMVTDPSGVDLLSSDPIWCRLVQVDNGRFVDVPNDANDIRSILHITDPLDGGGTFTKVGNTWVYDANGNCSHVTGPSMGGTFPDGGISVQLFPYDNTPNNGNVYKAWLTPVVDYTCSFAYAKDFAGMPANQNPDINNENCGPQRHGFLGAQSKTDNYKVRGGREPARLTVKKFHDANINGVKDTGEDFVTGWEIDITDPNGFVITAFTEVNVESEPPGNWTVVEDTPTGTLQTVGIRDGVQLSLYPTANPTVNVTVAGTTRETHEVVFGNVGLGSIEACKVFDRNANGTADAGEPGVGGWRMRLTGTTVLGGAVDVTSTTSTTNGCTTFSDLLPGSYRVTELLPLNGFNWTATGATFVDATITSAITNGGVAGTTSTVTFVNICEGTADFDTKGYWHNKNGLTELTDAFIDYVDDTYLPYMTPSPYFGDGDEPFDGFFSDGTPVQPAIGDGTWQGVEVAPAGTPKAEVSQFLVDPNGDGGPQEQLAQQLLAFIFNVEYRLGGGGTVQLPNGTFASTSSLITNAITAWSGMDQSQWTYWAGLLDWFNNNDAVAYVPNAPCPVVYP